MSLLHIGADLDPTSEIRQKLYLSNLYEWPKTDEQVDVGDPEATEIVWYVSYIYILTQRRGLDDKDGWHEKCHPQQAVSLCFSRAILTAALLLQSKDP